MRVTETDSSTLIERVSLMLVFTSLCVAIGMACLYFLDGGTGLPEYVGIFLGTFVLVPPTTLLLSLVVFLFLFIAFGASGRQSLQKIWIITTYFLNIFFCFTVLYALYEHKIWVAALDHIRNREYFMPIIVLIAIGAPALFVYLSSFLLTENLYLNKLEYVNESGDKR